MVRLVDDLIDLITAIDEIKEELEADEIDLAVLDGVICLTAYVGQYKFGFQYTRLCIDDSVLNIADDFIVRAVDAFDILVEGENDNLDTVQ